MYVCRHVFAIVYYRVLGCFVLPFVMYFITWNSLFLSSFDFIFFVCTFGLLIVCVFECLKTCRRIKCPLCLLNLFVNLYVWLRVSLFSVTFYIPVLSVSLHTWIHVTLYVWLFGSLQTDNYVYMIICMFDFN